MPETGEVPDDVVTDRPPQVRRGSGDGLELRGAGVSNDFSGRAEYVVQVGSVGTLAVHGLPAPPRPAHPPRQVPAPGRIFVNRLRELTALSDLLPVAGDPAPGIGVCWGVAGVGKSAVVRRFARSQSDRFPGGQLYVDFGQLRERGGAVVTDAVAGCLRALGVDDTFMPTDLAERIGLFRTRTADSPVLVVLDDVFEPAQVRSLIPGSTGSVVLATSDDSLGELQLDGADLLELEHFIDADAVALLVAQCGGSRLAADREGTERLVRLCGGLPLALAVAGARLATDRDLTVLELVRELTDERGRLAGLAIGGERVVSAALTTSYRHLPATARMMYRGLGLLPGPDFTADVAAVAAGVDQPAAIRTLTVLVTRRLVERPDPGRYRLPGLVRSHAMEVVAQESADEPDRFTPVLRSVLEHYLRVAALADHLVMGRRMRFTPDPAPEPDPVFGADPAAALQWLDRERVNLAAAQLAAQERGWDTLVWQLAETLTALYYNHRYLSDWEATGRRGARAAERQGRPDAAARLWALTSRAMGELGRLDDARSALDRALQLAEAQGDARLLASVWELRGRVLESVDPGHAMQAYQRSAELNRQAGEPRGAALVSLFLGQAMDAAGRSAEALETLTVAHRAFLAPDVDDPRTAARALAALGVARARTGDLSAAAQDLGRAAAEFSRRGMWHYEAQALEEWAAVQAQQGDQRAAEALLRRAIVIHQRFGGPGAQRLQQQLGTLGSAGSQD